MSSAKNYFLNLWKNNRAECVCFSLFALLALLSFKVHEPWYDEVQAWQIAKTATWYDILFRIPHFEGHPPFWHLLLALPAKAGIAGLLALRFIGMATMLLSGFLLIFKAPFPRWIKFTLPFTYFLFYQYGIIVRPYGLMALLLILLAITFPSKDEHPGRFVGLLAALCATHLFGIAIAGGITVAWLWDMKDNRPWGVFLCSLWTDKRFHWMLGLLLWALVLCLSIMPASNTRADQPYEASVLLNMLYVLFGLPADAFFTNLYKAFLIRRAVFQPNLAYFSTLLIGVLGWGFLLAFLPKQKRKYIWLPYMVMASLMLLYCSQHHIGLFTLLVIWVLWIALQDVRFSLPAWPEFAKKIANILLTFAILIPLFWTAANLYADSRLSVFSGKETVAFLKENGLLNKRIFSAWGRKNQNGRNIHNQTWAVQISFYTPKNIFANFHHQGSKMYNSFEALEGDKETTFARWRAGGVPEVLVGEVHLEEVWPEMTTEDYIPVYKITSYSFWKFDPPMNIPAFIYVRRDLAQALQLQSILPENANGTAVL